MARVATLACALAVSALIACSPRSASVVTYPDHSHPDDFRATSDRRFDDASRWAKIFDSPERAAWQRPEALLTAIELQSGMRVAYLGAGTGFFLPYLSRTVGDAGRVFAVEVEPELVTHMRERVARSGLDNVEVLLTAKDSLDLPPESIDMLLLIDVYHHIDQRRAYLNDARASLKNQGKIVIVDWKQGDLPVGPRDPHHKLPAEQVIRELDAVGFRLVPTDDVLPYQYVLVFTEKDPPLSR